MPESPKVALTIHEMRGDWSRLLRSTAAIWGVSLRETRSTEDLRESFSGQSVPIVTISLATRREQMLADLVMCRSSIPNALILVIEPSHQAEAVELIRELGATQVLSGAVLPPTVIDLLKDWVVLASQRRERVGWIRSVATPLGPPAPWFERWMGDWV